MLAPRCPTIVSVTARRAYGSGSIREKRPGVYELRWWTPPDPFTGKRTQRQETFTGARKAAQQRLGSIVAASDRGGSDTTLGALMEAWLATATLAPATIAAYRNRPDTRALRPTTLGRAWLDRTLLPHPGETTP